VVDIFCVNSDHYQGAQQVILIRAVKDREIR
jgi:hypothetical protein